MLLPKRHASAFFGTALASYLVLARGFAYTADEIPLKPWPSSRLSQGGIQLSLKLMDEHGIGVEEIDRITVHLPDIYLRPHQYDPAPRTYWEGIYSVQ